MKTSSLFMAVLAAALILPNFLLAFSLGTRVLFTDDKNQFFEGKIVEVKSDCDEVIVLIDRYSGIKCKERRAVNKNRISVLEKKYSKYANHSPKVLVGKENSWQELAIREIFSDGTIRAGKGAYITKNNYYLQTKSFKCFRQKDKILGRTSSFSGTVKRVYANGVINYKQNNCYDCRNSFSNHYHFARVDDLLSKEPVWHDQTNDEAKSIVSLLETMETREDSWE